MVKGIIKHIFTLNRQKESFGVFPLLVFFILLWIPFSGNGQSKITPVVLESAQLAIGGNTNINNFTCQLFRLNLNDTLTYVSETADGAEIFNGLVLKFNVSDFACNHSMMTNDFKELLKAEDFPYIIMHINDVIVHKPSRNDAFQSISAHITLTIAGHSKHEFIEDASIEQTDQWLALKGAHKVLMTTFEIEPPIKLFGTVRTENAIEILFSIKVK